MKAARLQVDDTIGIVSPSWGGAALFPHRIEQGIRFIHELGYKVKTAAHALNYEGYLSDSAENRVQDIHDMFLDPEIKAIIATIGGDHSCHLLPLLDFDLIASHPKIFMGYSDITVLNIAIWTMTGLTTFNGPAVMTDFAENPQMLAYTQRYMHKAIASPDPIGRINHSPWWTEETPDWGTMEDLTRPRMMLPTPGWTWLKPGIGSGKLIGGCIESLNHLRGTRYWPDWEGAILFIETSEDKPLPSTMDGLLMDYENMGVFDQIQGLLVGRPMRYSDVQKEALRSILLERTKRYKFPIITDMDFGHTAPQFTLPIGCMAQIDTKRQCFEIIEGAVV
jgi:muramoyltetrapeptide carboxypeptidase